MTQGITVPPLALTHSHPKPVSLQKGRPAGRGIVDQPFFAGTGCEGRPLESCPSVQEQEQQNARVETRGKPSSTNQHRR